MVSFTLDTNCIIDVAESRPAARDVIKLAQAHSEKRANVAVIAIAASEKQKGGGHIENFNSFCERLNTLGLGHLEILPAMAYWDITYFDRCLWASEEMERFELKIHSTLFPNIAFPWNDYCAQNGLDPKGTSIGTTWRNAKCDVQGLWSHIHHKRDVFVTSDGRFHANVRKEALIQLGAGRIEYPGEAAAQL